MTTFSFFVWTFVRSVWLQPRAAPSPSIHPSATSQPQLRVMVVRDEGGKYKLLKSADGQRGVCAFFNLPQGCRNGAKCPFLHEAPKPAQDEEPAGLCGHSADAHFLPSPILSIRNSTTKAAALFCDEHSSVAL